MNFKKKAASILAVAAAILFLPLSGKAEAAGSVTINEKNFPDENFRAYVSKEYDSNQSGILSATEIAAATEMNCCYSGITSMKGIEFFTALTALNCCHNQLGSLDLSRNTALTELSCHENQLTELDLSRNTALTALHCYDNQLTELDLSKNTKLKTLLCFGNQLSSIDLKNNQELTYFDCSNNQFVSLDLSANASLSELLCSENQMNSLDLSGNPALTYLCCSSNYIQSLDLSGNKALENLTCSENGLRFLSLENNGALSFLSCSGNRLSSLDLSAVPALQSLSCCSNGLVSLNLSKCTVLKDLDCSDNDLNLLDIASCGALKEAYLSGSRWDDEDRHVGYYSENGFLFVDQKTTVVTKTGPLILTQPHDLTVRGASYAEFHVEAYGSTSLCYTWQYRKSSDESWKRCSSEGSDTDTMRVEAKAYRDGFQYRCKVKNDGGTAWSKTVVLHIKPGITAQPKTLTAAANQIATFSVKAEGKNLSYLWQYRRNENESWKSCSSEGCDSAALRVQAKTFRDGFQYRCKIRNDNGTAWSKTAVLHIKPAITLQPQTQTVAASQLAVFHVKAEGNNLRYLWQYRRSGESGWKSCISEGYDTDTIRVEAKAFRNAFEYRCKVMNENGTVWSATAVLYIKPGITSQPETQIVSVSQTASFAVKAEGGGLSYQWYYRTGENSAWNRCSSEGYDTSCLTVEGKRFRSGYQYRCKVSNANGYAYSEPASLIVN